MKPNPADPAQGGAEDQEGKAVAFPELIDDGRPVLLNFIYTNCTAICPPMTRIFADDDSVSFEAAYKDSDRYVKTTLKSFTLPATP